MSSYPTSDLFDTDGRPQPAATAEQLAERKLKVWAVLNAVELGLMNVAEACAAYSIAPAELDAHRAEWREFEAGRR